MKKMLSLILLLAMLTCLFSGCNLQKERPELIVFAAASLEEPLTELKKLYLSEHPEIPIRFYFDSSGTLKTAILNGADCDIFISAGQRQMDELDINADPSVNTEEVDRVVTKTRFNILENKVVLVVPANNPANINSFDDLIAGLEAGTVLLAMGNSDVPVGQYTQKILAYYGLDEKALAQSGCVTYGSNVKEVTTQISEGVVDCGMIYATDAFSAGLTVVDTATAEMCGQVIYPAARLKTSKNREAADAFLEFLKSDAADAVFEAVGFTPIG